MSWAVLSDERVAGGTAVRARLRDPDRRLSALITVERKSEATGVFAMRVAFEHDAIPMYAHAEGARLLAQLCDSVGDLLMGGDDPLDIREPYLSGSIVVLRGIDGPTAVSVFFDEPTTSELIDILQDL